MNEKLLKQQILNHLAEQAIPADYDPWEAMQSRLLSQYPERKSLGPISGSPTILSMRGLKLAMLAAVLLILLTGAVYLSTPEGQVTAKALLGLFTNTSTNTIPLPPGVPTEGIRPTLTPGGPPRHFGPPTPWPSQEAGNVVYGLTLADAEKLAQFKIRVPGSIPDGFRLDDISYDRQSHAVEQLYDLIARNGPSFLLEQSPTPASQPIGPDAAIHQYRVGDTLVEWVDGGWFVYVGSDHQEWEPELDTRTFRWMQDGYYFTMWFQGMTHDYGYQDDGRLTMAEMQALIEVVMGVRAGFPNP
jgi:hypothetical protein